MNRKYLFPIIMWSTATLFLFYEFFLQVSPSVMTQNLMHAFQINGAQLGILASAYFYAYAAMQIPVGVMLDRFGARRLLTVAVLFCAVGAVLFGHSHTLIIAIIARILIGFGSAFATISCMYIASLWLPLKWFSLLTGLLLTIGMLGAVCGEAPLALMVEKFDWRATMFILGFVGIAVAIAIWSIVRDKKVAQHNPKLDEKRLLHGLKVVMHSGQTWISAIYAGLLYTPTLVFGSLWGVPFIMTKFHLTKPAAATVVSALFIGWAIGAPVFGWFSDHYKKRKLFILIGVIGTLIAMSLTVYSPVEFGHYFAGFTIFATGFFTSSLIIAFSLSREINPPATTGAAMGFMNALNMLGGAIIPPIVGLILDLLANGPNLHSTHSYSLPHYIVALTLLPVILLISLVLACTLRETHAREL